MHPSIQVLKNALGYAKIQDDEVHDCLYKLIDELGSDLENPDADYEPSIGVENAVSALEEALNNVDSDEEDVDAAIREAKDEPVDDDEDDTDPR